MSQLTMDRIADLLKSDLGGNSKNENQLRLPDFVTGGIFRK